MPYRYPTLRDIMAHAKNAAVTAAAHPLDPLSARERNIQAKRALRSRCALHVAAQGYVHDVRARHDVPVIDQKAAAASTS